MKKHANIRIERGSGNVFADLGYPDAESHLAKATLVTQIDIVLRERKLTQAAAAQVLGLSQPDISRLLRGHFRNFSVERLTRLLRTLGQDVEILIRASKARRPGRLHVITTSHKRSKLRRLPALGKKVPRVAPIRAKS